MRAGGLVPDQFEFLLRRSTHFADIMDYPEPSTSVWMKERHASLQHESNLLQLKKKRLLVEVGPIWSQYHRFFWMLSNSCEGDKQNLRVEDDITESLDPQRVWIVKDLDRKRVRQ